MNNPVAYVDNEATFRLFDKVIYKRESLIGSEECSHCGSYVDKFEDIESEHTVIGIDGTYEGKGVWRYFYRLSDRTGDHYVPESSLRKVSE